MRGLWLIYERMSSMDAFFELAGNSLKECSAQLQPLLQKLGCTSGSRCKCSLPCTVRQIGILERKVQAME